MKRYRKVNSSEGNPYIHNPYALANQQKLESCAYCLIQTEEQELETVRMSLPKIYEAH